MLLRTENQLVLIVVMNRGEIRTPVHAVLTSAPVRLVSAVSLLVAKLLVGSPTVIAVVLRTRRWAAGARRRWWTGIGDFGKLAHIGMGRETVFRVPRPVVSVDDDAVITAVSYRLSFAPVAVGKAAVVEPTPASTLVKIIEADEEEPR